MTLNELIETTKGRHVRTADVLRAISKSLRAKPGDATEPATYMLRALALSNRIEQLAATLDAVPEQRAAA